MAGEELLDSLTNLSLVLSADLKRVHENMDDFVRMADAEQIQQFEATITEVRTLAEQLERELSYVEYLLANPLQ